MSWTDYLYIDYYTATRLQSLDKKIRDSRRSSARSDSGMLDRIDQLEGEVARLTVMTHALAEALVEKELLSREEITTMLEAVELAREQEAASATKQKPRSVAEYLHDLKKADAPSPKEFLERLEDEE